MNNMIKTLRYDLILKRDNGCFITLESGTLDEMKYMIKWYNVHSEYFNGTFHIFDCKTYEIINIDN